MKVIYVQHLPIQTTLITIHILPHAVGVHTAYGFDLLTPCSTVVLEKPAVSQVVKHSLHLMESEYLLPHSQVPASSIHSMPHILLSENAS